VASAAPAATTPSPVAPPEPSTPTQTAAIEPAADSTALRIDEVKELQVKLRTFGFNPGAVDGVAGPMTQSAAMRYQQARGQWQTGTVDRELLAQLREDPAPQPVEQTAAPEPRPPRAARPRYADPFDSMRTAAQRAGRWLDSLLR